ncbi:hypothetical protein MR829_13630 [Paracoccus versutus]|uniref:hypothetical protein n=1 Tax=Paracoccus versutus TaxID=34007 RepID=UPI001FB6FC4C|nr:hypothetical protein [Paracoccus versutus]MCJ1901410.1 hypothetical protein [Paracoccus versutus]
MTPAGRTAIVPAHPPGDQQGEIERMTVNLEKKLAELCKEKGMRLTGQRRVILQVLSDSAENGGEKLGHGSGGMELLRAA